MIHGRLQGKTALVTGAGSGIGKAIATLFAREGARVMVADIDVAAAAAAAAGITVAGGKALSLHTDTTREVDVKTAILAVADTWGQIDIMVNNAGIGGQQHTWDQIIAVNQTGVYFGCLYSFEQMVKQGGGGAIVNVSSMLGLVGATPTRGVPGGFGYGYHASKHAVVGLTRQFGLDAAPHNIRVNALCPGWIDTPLVEPLKAAPPLLRYAIAGTPLGRLGTPDEIAKAALFLSSDDSSFVTGTCLVVDGGWTAR